MGCTLSIVRRKWGIAPYSKAILRGSKGEELCNKKITELTTINPIVTKGNLRVGLSSLNGIMIE
jgi:hypothetical protein